MALPTIHPESSIAPTATLIGDVRIGAGTRVLSGAVLDAGDGTITIAGPAVIMEHAVLRATARFPLSIGSHCLIGPHATLSGAMVGDEVFIATGASVFPAAVIGAGSEVRINAVVHLRTELPQGSTVPIGWIAVGAPATILPPSEHGQIWAVQRELDFPGFVFGVDREGERPMRDMVERYSDYLGRSAAAREE